MKNLLISLGMTFWILSFIIGIYQFSCDFGNGQQKVRKVEMNIELS